MIEKKEIPENLIACVTFEKRTSVNAECEKSQPSVLERCDWSHEAFFRGEFLKVNAQ